jgi:protoporphyrinogen oxidase
MRIAIIGGGPGGLMTAHLLERRAPVPLDITLFEASDRLGGKIVTRRFNSAPLAYEAGAAELYDYSMIGPDPLRELVRELDLSTRPLEGKAIVLGDRLLNTDEDIRRHLGQNTYDVLQGFRARSRSLITPSDYYESDWKEDNQDPLSRQRFDDLLSAIPDEAARKLIRVAVHSDLATEPHQTNAMYALQNYLMNEPGYMRLYTIEGGIESLTKRLAERISSRILLNHRVISVARTPENKYRVLARRSGQVMSDEFDFVAVALPNNWIPTIEWQDDALARAMHAHHVHYDYPAHYLRASLLFKNPFWREQITESYFMLDAFEGCCIYDESSRRDGSTFGALGWLLAGEAALNLSNLQESSLIEQVLDSLPSCLRHGRELFIEGHVHRWVGSVSGLPTGYPAREPESRHVPEPQENPRLFVVGDYLFDSTLNGVLDSADVVTEWILEEIQDAKPTAET